MHHTQRAYWLSALGWAVLIWTLSSIPDLKSTLPSFWDFFLRKLAHAVEFGIFALLLFRASASHPGAHRRSSLLFAGLVALLYAISDEWHQWFTPGRVGSLTDVGIDSLGILLFLQIFRNKGMERKKTKPRTGA